MKRFIFSLVIGLIAYTITKITLQGGFQFPATTPDISLALIFIATAFAAMFVAGGSAASSEESYDDDSSYDEHDGDQELGTVKWFNVRKGYGFITRDQGEDIFVHFRNIESDDRRAISEGQRVSFIVIDSEKGLQADKVNPA